MFRRPQPGSCGAICTINPTSPLLLQVHALASLSCCMCCSSCVEHSVATSTGMQLTSRMQSTFTWQSYDSMSGNTPALVHQLPVAQHAAAATFAITGGTDIKAVVQELKPAASADLRKAAHMQSSRHRAVALSGCELCDLLMSNMPLGTVQQLCAAARFWVAYIQQAQVCGSWCAGALWYQETHTASQCIV